MVLVTTTPTIETRRHPALSALDAVWSVFWSLATLPVHVALRMAGGKGFSEKDRTPAWAILLTAYVLVCVGFGI